MMQLPAIPAWESLHPLVVHFPIVLLFVSPVFVLVSTVLPPLKGRPYLIAGLALLLAGTASLYVAAETGEAAAELADRTAASAASLHSHEQLASLSRLVFSGLSVLLVALFSLPHLLPRLAPRLVSTTLPLIFLALYSTGMLALVDTAHQGGRLVHQYGIHALMPAERFAGDTPPAQPGE
jgi:uncharacterized membrane protein